MKRALVSLSRRAAVVTAAVATLTLLSGVAGLAGDKTGVAQAVPFFDLDVPFVTTPDNVVTTMLDIAKVQPGEYVLDLGSGDGRIVITAALKYGAHGMGVEIDPSLVVQSNQHAKAAGVADRANFVERDLYMTDLSPANVITMYLLPDVNLKLRPKLLGLKPGVRLVSHDWDMGDWPPNADVEIPAPQKRLGLRKVARLRMWVVPANAAGHYQPLRAASSGSADTTAFDLTLEQQYQHISAGRLTLGSESYTIAPSDVDGPSVMLTARDAAGRIARLSARFDTQKPAAVDWRLDIEGQPSRTLHASFEPPPPPPEPPADKT